MRGLATSCRKSKDEGLKKEKGKKGGGLTAQRIWSICTMKRTVGALPRSCSARMKGGSATGSNRKVSNVNVLFTNLVNVPVLFIV